MYVCMHVTHPHHHSPVDKFLVSQQLYQCQGEDDSQTAKKEEKEEEEKEEEEEIKCDQRKKVEEKTHIIFSLRW